MSTAEHEENSALPGAGTTSEAWFDEAAARAFEAAAERVRASWDDVSFEAPAEEGLLPPEPWLPVVSSTANPVAAPAVPAPAFPPAPAQAVPAPAFLPAPARAVPAPPAPAPAALSTDVVGRHAPVRQPLSAFERLPTQRTQPSLGERLSALSQEKRWLLPTLGLLGALALALAWPRSEPVAEQPHSAAPASTTPPVEAAPPPASGASARTDSEPAAAATPTETQAPMPEAPPVVEPAREPAATPAAQPRAARERSPEHRHAGRPAPRESRSAQASSEATPRKRPVRESAATRPPRGKANGESAALVPERPKETPKPRKGTGFVSANPY